MGISGANDGVIEQAVKDAGFSIEKAPFDIGAFCFQNHVSEAQHKLKARPINRREIKFCKFRLALYFAGEVSFHSGWVFHRADGNSTETPRQVLLSHFQPSLDALLMR